MKALLDRLRQESVTLTVYNYDGSKERLETIGTELASSGVAVRTDTTGRGEPANLGVFHSGDDIHGAVSLDERWPAEIDFEDLLEDGDAVEYPSLPVLPTEQVTVSPETTRKRMVGISRNFERLALREGGGRLLAGFQELSVVTESERTRSVYERLAESGVDTCVYGYPDADIGSPSFEVVEDTSEQFRDHWFLLYDGNGNDQRKAALVSEEHNPALYDSFWTVDPDIVDELFAIAGAEYPDLL
jgi:hypothetical protein